MTVCRAMQAYLMVNETGDEGQRVPLDVRRMLTTGLTPTCPEGATGRVAIAAPPSSEGAYVFHDVSLCNIMGMGADYLFVPFANQLYVMGDPVGIPAVIAIGVLVIFLMVIMGHNLQVGTLSPMALPLMRTAINL